jgi:hypothetical protein
VEVVKAISPGPIVASAARLIDSLSPVMRSSREMLAPLRGRNPWFASVFNIGQGLRSKSESNLEYFWKAGWGLTISWAGREPNVKIIRRQSRNCAKSEEQIFELHNYKCYTRNLIGLKIRTKIRENTGGHEQRLKSLFARIGACLRKIRRTTSQKNIEPKNRSRT